VREREREREREGDEININHMTNCDTRQDVISSSTSPGSSN